MISRQSTVVTPPLCVPHQMTQLSCLKLTGWAPHVQLRGWGLPCPGLQLLRP